MANTTTWAIDPMHSQVQFKIKHLVISTVTGSFRKFEGKAIIEGDDFTDAKINVKIDVKSIDTGQSHRDEHLQGGDFFGSETYPEISFQSASFTKENEDNYKMTGNLTIKGVTKPVELNIEYGGSEKDKFGHLKHGFEVTGKINRRDFGMTYNSITEAGGLTLGEEIKLVASIQIAQVVEKLRETEA